MTSDLPSRAEREQATTTDARRTPAWLRFGALALIPLVVSGLLVAAFAGIGDGLQRVPALIVNNDEMVEQVGEDGETQVVLAGRLLVTELTSSENETFSWSLSSTEQAEQALADGTAYVVLTIPSDFSSSVLSLGGDDPVQAQLQVVTDDSHSYLAGTVTEAVADGMAKTFGTALTEQVIEGIYTGISGVGGSLQDAADGAGALADGVGELGDGLGQLADGAGQAAVGADQYTAGVVEFRGGLKQLRDGLRELASGTAQLDTLGDGLSGYIGAVDSASASYLDHIDDIMATPGLTADELTALGTMKATLQGVAPGADSLLAGAGSLGDVGDGVGALSDGMDDLYAGSAGLRDGAAELANGLDGIAGGLDDVTEGTTALQEGAQELADGLASGAAEVPSYDDDQVADAAAVAADPVGVTVTRDNLIADGAQGTLALFLPIGLWVGALAVSLLGGLRRSALASTAGSGRLVLGDALRQLAITVPQAVILGAVIPPLVGVDLALVPAVAGIAVLLAVVFTAVHQLLRLIAGRWAVVVSVLLLTVQLASSGGIYPIEMLAEPFGVISPLLPLSHAVTAVQTTLAQGSVGSVLASLGAVLAFGLLAGAASMALVGRRRTARALGLVTRIA